MPPAFVAVLGLFLSACLLDVSWLASEGGLLMASASSLSGALRRRRGRPKKFDEPARVVSLTLPESVIAHLSTLHPDLGRAVVALTAKKAPSKARGAAELVVFGKHAVISVRPTPTLERRTGVQLVPLPDGRALISFEAPQTVADLELSISDALEDAALPREDRLVFEAIRSILRDARRAKDVSLLRRNIIVLRGIPARTSRKNGTNGAGKA